MAQEEEKREKIASLRRKFKEQHRKILMTLEMKNKEEEKKVSKLTLIFYLSFLRFFATIMKDF